MDPFDDLTESLCPLAWHGGLRRPPTWARDPELLLLDTASVHVLLRAAGLPRAELMFMGWGDWALSASAPATISERLVAPLLGRIVLDASMGSAIGLAWSDAQFSVATAAGQRVLERYFPGEDVQGLPGQWRGPA